MRRADTQNKGHRNLAVAVSPWILLIFAVSFGLFSDGLPEAIRLFLGYAVVYPVLEELTFRGWCQTLLLKKPLFAIRRLGISPANLFTSILFALAHWLVREQSIILLVFFPSLLLGWVREKAGSVGYGILLHGLMNIFYFNVSMAGF